MSDPVKVTAGCVVGIPLGLGALGLLILKLLNMRKTITLESEPPPLTGWKKWVVFFFKEVLLELVGFAYGIYTIYQLNTSTFGGYDVSHIAVAFYIFFALKYLLIIYLILEDQVVSVKNFTITLANTGWIPPNWPELATNWIFIPVIVVDGILYNIDYINNNTSAGDLTPYDSLALMILDAILFIKFGVLDTLEAYTHGYHYKVISIYYAMCEFVYTVVLIFLAIFVSLIDITNTGSTVPTSSFVLVLVVAILHPIISRFTSMCLQGIKSITSSYLLRQVPKVRLAALRIYIHWFHFGWINLIVCGVCYGVTFYLYISIWVITSIMSNKITVRDEPVIQGFIMGLLILVNIFTVFYMINLSYALIKRLSVFLSRCCGMNCGFPFDCSTYAKAMNRGLANCNANFMMNTHMQVTQ
eukprot:TRINITY_DN3500_c0_g1_i1.p1 TRINITY_DN3500_c0_g1~~TRINITY_DN3500_c0_g1_i1.p1  ORF type:complete len:414 (+),score=66.88 TRINITY_DN3500_c0_g1_i1:37-1278(+)